ncbi:MAG: hypothetical protein ACKO96_00040 [Flammeovirgaceae bacterium]
MRWTGTSRNTIAKAILLFSLFVNPVFTEDYNYIGRDPNQDYSPVLKSTYISRNTNQDYSLSIVD